RIVRNRLRMVSNLRRIEFMTESPRTSGRIPSAVPAPPGLRVLDEALDFLSPAPPAATRGMAAARQEPPSGDSTTFASLLAEDDLAGAASTAALDARVVHARCHIAAPLVLAAPADAIDAGMHRFVHEGGHQPPLHVEDSDANGPRFGHRELDRGHGIARIGER